MGRHDAPFVTLLSTHSLEIHVLDTITMYIRVDLDMSNFIALSDVTSSIKILTVPWIYYVNKEI